MNALNEATMAAVLDPANLREALRRVRANGGAAGIDRMRTTELEGHLQEHWPSIREKLEQGRYKPTAIKRVYIDKPGGGSRPLGIPTVLDRFIQQAIAQTLTGVFDPLMSENSYGFRPGRSAHQAVEAARGYVREGKDCVVDIDLKSFFDEVNHEILMNRICERVKDKTLRSLIGRYLKAPVMTEGKRTPTQKGVPQGGPLSPLLANVYLDALDKELESRGLSFCRYADDCNIYVSSPAAAERVFDSVTRWIGKHLRLPINRQKSDIGHPWDRQFLGYQITNRNTLRPSPKNLDRFKAQTRGILSARWSGTSNELRDRWQAFVRGWSEYYRIADEPGWSRPLSQWVRRHMRKCFWQRWHNAKGRKRHLNQLGITDRALKRCDLWGAAWPSAKTPVLHRALNNRTLRRYGFLAPSDFVPT